jgi:hypothetical protein
VQYRQGVPQSPKNFRIERVGDVRPHERATPVRVSPTSAVPSRLTAWVVVVDPHVRVDLELVIMPAAKPQVRELTVTAATTDGPSSISTSLLRRVLVDPIVDAVMAKAVRAAEGTVIDRSDVAPGAYQLPADPEDEFWVPGTPAVDPRVRRTARVYAQAVAFGNRSPTVAVAEALGMSKASASRYVRMAREANLLPPLGEPVEDPTNAQHLGMWRYLADQLRQGEDMLSTADSAEDRASLAERVNQLRGQLAATEAKWRAYRSALRGQGLSPDPLPADLAYLDEPNNGGLAVYRTASNVPTGTDGTEGHAKDTRPRTEAGQ